MKTETTRRNRSRQTKFLRSMPRAHERAHERTHARTRAGPTHYTSRDTNHFLDAL